MVGTRRLWGLCVLLSVLVHLAPWVPQVAASLRGELPNVFLSRSSWREALAGAARSRQRVVLADVILVAPSVHLLRVATRRPEVRTERLRAIQGAIRLAWDEAAAAAPGRALVSLRVGEDGRIHEYVIQRLVGGDAFQGFLLAFVRTLLRAAAVAGPGDPLWVECEFVVEPPP